MLLFFPYFFFLSASPSPPPFWVPLLLFSSSSYSLPCNSCCCSRIWRKFADNCKRIFIFIWFFPSILFLLSLRVSLNGQSRSRRRRRGWAKGGKVVLFQFTTKWRSITIQCLKFLSRCGRQQQQQNAMQRHTQTHTSKYSGALITVCL